MKPWILIYCPLCGLEIVRHLPYDPLEDPQITVWEDELQCRLHLRRYHRRRFWLWCRLRWKWLVRGFV